MDTQALIVQIYGAFNKRDVDGALAVMSEDVSWPKASEGGRVVGKQAIREYWTRQWAEFDPVVNVLEVINREGGVTDVKVHQLVKDLKGNILSDTELWHVYSFTEGLIDRMEIKEGEATLEGPSAAFPGAKHMKADSAPGGTFSMGTDLTVSRIGYGAMQLAGPHVFGPPADRDGAIAVLRQAIALGITHIDTSDYYGPHVTNQIIKEALHPYPSDLHIVTKVGARRDEHGGWPQALTPAELRSAVHDNLRNLGLDVLDVVNLRVGGPDRPERGSIAEAFGALAEMQREGLIRHLGVSTVFAEQIAEAQSIAPVACVQNFYNVANREDDELIDALASQGIAFVPYFPLGGFTPLQSSALDAVAARHGVPAQSVALAWLLQRSPNVLVIPGTSSIAHLRENVMAAQLTLSAADLDELNAIASERK